MSGTSPQGHHSIDSDLTGGTVNGGGLQSLLAFASAKEVAQATQRAIEDSGRAKTLIGSTSEIHPEIKVENALAIYETAKKSTFG